MSSYKPIQTQIVSSKVVGMGSSTLKERKDLKNGSDTDKLKNELNQRELKSLEKKGLSTSLTIENDKDLVKLKNQLIKEDELEKQENLKKRKGIDDDDTDSSDDDDDNDDDGSDSESTKHRNKINKINNSNHNDIDNSNNNNNNDSDDDANNDSGDSDDDDSDDSDDEEELLRELEKIKREKAEQQKRKEEEQAKDLERERLERVAHGNPLLNSSGGSGNYSTNKSWLDDGVFKNQARDEPIVKKRFINDTTRNDFAKKFLSKYIK